MSNFNIYVFFLGMDEIPFDFTSMMFCNFFLWEVVFIRDTAACKCYGCNGSVRRKPSEDPPPAPYDIFLRRREYRVYRKKGSTKMCIAKTKEFVYYHPLKACLPKESSHGDLLMSENTTSRLQASHREVFWREFGFTLWTVWKSHTWRCVPIVLWRIIQSLWIIWLCFVRIKPFFTWRIIHLFRNE